MNEGKGDSKSGYIHNLTEEESIALGNLREIFKDAHCVEFPKGIDDLTLLRFLRARDFNVKKTEKMLREHLEWRNKFTPKSITPTDIKDGLLLGAWKLAGKTKDGRSVILVDISKLDFSVFKTGDDYVKLTAYMAELSLGQMEASGVELEKHMIIFDMDGWTLTKHGGPHGMRMTSALAGMVQNQYPERGYLTVILNPSTFFEAAWAVIRPWLDKRTSERIVFMRDPIGLQKWIDPDQLLVRYSGTRTEEYPMVGVDQILDITPSAKSS